MERQVLGSCVKSREAYEATKNCDLKDTFSDAGKIVWEMLSTYYERDDKATCIDEALLSKRIESAYPKHSKAILNNICLDDTLSVPNVLQEIIALTKENIRVQLISALSNSQDKEVEKLLSKWEDVGSLVQGKEAVLYNATAVADLVEREQDEHKIALLPAALNKALGGGIKPQHHVLIFSLTDMGKTLFTLNAAYGFVKQGLRVGYFGNEDPGGDLMMRFLIRLTGMTKEEIKAQPDKAQQLADERNYHNFFLFEMAPGTPKEMEDNVVQHDLDIVIVDQIRNIDMKEDHKVSQMEKAATAVRNMAKRRNIPIISVSQASDSASGKAVLGRGDVDSSNVGLPGQVDLMIGIGATEEMEARGQRTLSFPKNKISGEKVPLGIQFDYRLMKVTG
jgi:archaellum biogenesis ATPase FlaH